MRVAVALVLTPAVQVISCVGLPFLALTFVNDNAILAAGYDMNPVLFRAKGLPDGTERWCVRVQAAVLRAHARVPLAHALRTPVTP